MHKNKKIFLAFFLLIFSSGLFLSLSPASAADGFNYQLLEKIPGMEGVSGSDLPGYVKAVYNTALVIVVLSAVLMLSIGGFMYLTSAGNTAALTTAKGVIFDAVIGLVIALAAWLLLNVINPDLVNVTINGLSAISTAGVPLPVPSADQYSDAEARAALAAAGIFINKANCSNPSDTDCTSLDGIPKSTVNNLISLKSQSGCLFQVTGGTEAGHLSHGPGKPVVDVTETGCLKSFLRTKIAQGSLTTATNITQICATQTNQDVAFQCSTIEAVPHFHLVFKT